MKRFKREQIEILTQFAEGVIDRTTAATKLSVSPRTVNRWMRIHELKRTTRRERAAKRREAKRALQQQTAEMTISEAAAYAGVSERTIMRWRKANQA